MSKLLSADSKNSFNLIVFLLFIPAGYITFFFHEFGHWIIGELLGNDMIFTLNGVRPKSGHFMNSLDDLYITLGGPIFTIFQAIIFLIIIEKYKTIYAYPFVFFPVFMRWITLTITLTVGHFNAQDEAIISSILNIGTYTIALILLGILLIIVLRSSYKLKIGLKYNCYFMAISTVCFFLVIETDKLIWG
jgi:hypothetical protein